jgi:hypothetical protein
MINKYNHTPRKHKCRCGVAIAYANKSGLCHMCSLALNRKKKGVDRLEIKDKEA